MDLAARRLILLVVPVPGGSLVVVDHEWGGVRQHVVTRLVESVSDEQFEIPVSFDERWLAGPGIFAPAIAAALGVGTSATIVTVLSTIASVAAGAVLSLGLSLLEQALFGDGQTAAGPPSNVPVRQIVKQSTPRQRFIFGRALAGGAYCYLNRRPPYLITQFLVAAHRCDAIEAVYINGFRCEFNTAGQAVTPRFRKGGSPYLTISTRLGDPDQAIDPLLAAEFPDIPTTFRQRGHTVVTLRAYYGTDYDDHEDVWGAGGTFRPLFLVRGRLVHDPRIPSSDPDDETTWAWSNNWALCMADWMRSAVGGRKKVDQIDYAAIAAEADICDQGVGLSAGGAEARYTLNGGLQSDENPFGLAEAMLAAAGRSACLWRRGQFAPQVDVPRSSVRTLTEGDLIAGFTFRSGRARSDTLNTIRSEFLDDARDYKAALTPPLADAALIASDGQPLERTAQRGFVVGAERAQRLDKITLKRSRLGREMKISVGIEHLALEAGDQVTIQFDNFPQCDGDYVIRSASAGGLLRTMELMLEEAPGAVVHEWDPATEVQDTTLVEIINPEAV